jgi:hypothetical protein
MSPDQKMSYKSKRGLRASRPSIDAKQRIQAVYSGAGEENGQEAAKVEDHCLPRTQSFSEELKVDNGRPSHRTLMKMNSADQRVANPNTD